MTWVVVVFSGSGWAKRVIGPMSKENAEWLALGIQAAQTGGGGNQAAAVPLEAP